MVLISKTDCLNNKEPCSSNGLIIVGFLGIPVAALIRFIRKRRNPSQQQWKNPWKVWLLTLFVVVFIGLLYLGITSSLERNYYILGFGILSRWNWIFWLIPAILDLLIYFFWQRSAFFKEDLNTVGKILGLCSLLGAAAFIGLLAYWNVL